MDELEYYNGQLTGQEIDYRIVSVNTGSISSLPTTIENSKIMAKHVLLWHRLSSPSVQVDDWTVTTADGSFTVSGTINGTATLYLVFGIPG